jgi:LysR family cyn operon transcriptional activator
MELRHLRYFAALAEHLNFTRAAQQVHVTQSTLSHQIKQLELEVGRQLFDRAGKRVVMTEAGEQLLPQLKRALREIDDGLRTIQGNVTQLTGHLRIGVTHTFNISLIPLCVAEFLRKHRSVRVSVKEMHADTIAKGLEDGDFDLGITYRPHDNTELSFEPLCHDEMALLVPAQHQFWNRKRVCMSELHRQELILYTKNTATQEFLDGWFRSAGAEPIVIVEMNACAPMPSYVRRLGIPCIMSRLGAPEGKDLKIVPIENPTPMRTPGILWNRTHAPTPAAKSFAAIIRHTIGTIGKTSKNGQRASAIAGIIPVRPDNARRLDLIKAHVQATA